MSDPDIMVFTEPAFSELFNWQNTKHTSGSHVFLLALCFDTGTYPSLATRIHADRKINILKICQTVCQRVPVKCIVVSFYTRK